KGTPTDVSVKFCPLGTPVRESGPTDRPHILAIFREGLIEPLALWRGLHPDARVLINTRESPAAMRERVRLPSGQVVCADASGIALETGSRLNMPMLALAAEALGFPHEPVREAVAKAWPRGKEANLAAYDLALERRSEAEFADDGRFPLEPPAPSRGPIGYRNMLEGGAISALTHTTAQLPNPAANPELIPEFDREACNDCALCLLACGDAGAIVWEGGRMVAIDPAYCKQCWRCVRVCPLEGKALRLPAAAQVEGGVVV
ncbi:MAG: 2-oxoacid:acceptor oxidoreductase family protein, partial [Nitrospinota bacterium]